MRMVLIGNYRLDKQESMLRFADMLDSGLKAKGIQSEIWEPTIFFGKIFESTNSGIAKWVGYIDKFIVFPIVIKLRLKKQKYKNLQTRFHICDHSNAPYLKYLPKNITGITCHDVLAIRGALGYKDTFAEPSKFGVFLQKWIFKNLVKAKLLGAVSNFSLNQLEELHNDDAQERKWVVIHNAFNAPFAPMDKVEYLPLLESMGLNKEPFILHVGTSHPRKNRIFLVNMMKALEGKWNGKLCLASKPLDKPLIELAKELGIENKIISVVRPDHKYLIALYSACRAFVFPSFSEGFGWPVIEAQACGAPVIASDLEPMPEVSGNAALHNNPKDANAFANALLSLENKEGREKLIEKGYENIKRFELNKMIDSYLSLYGFENIQKE
ncbi:glycosyltransferase family 1 protein [uncultured Algibacter sp.]|uniref:glycosyltransferase family 4 protein n=1 Tax=uncultured Algibacter sp. TaxID=298659 RepID=UPI003217E2F2